MPKNVLFIAADDLYDWDRYRTRWGITVATPNFDRLIAKGTKFANAFCPIAVCHPSRTSTMSGYTPWQTGIFNNYTKMLDVLDVDQLWPMEFRKAGYHLGSAGKIYHSEDNSSQGTTPIPELNARLYDDPAPDLRPLFPSITTHTYTDFTEGFTGTGLGTGEGGGAYGFHTGDDEFFDAKVADAAIAFLSTYAGDRPFYWECGFSQPHVPRHVPIRFIEDIVLEDLTPPADWEGGWEMAAFAEDAFVGPTTLPPSQWTASQLLNWRVLVRGYIAALRHLDYQIGRVLDALEASPHANTTIITFLSDHGYELWSHGYYQKFTLWEQSCAIPLVICDPDSPAGQNVTTPATALDLGPTIMDLCDIPVPSHHVGQSLRAAVENTGPAPERMILSAWYSGVSGRTDTHRITLYSDGTSEYFDIAADPWTQENLAADNPPPASFSTDRTALLGLAQDWGILVVEEGVDIARPTPFAVYLGKERSDLTFASRAYVSYGDLMPSLYPRGSKKAWVQPGQQNQVLRVPVGFEKIGVPHHLVTDNNIFTISANAQANSLDIANLNPGYQVTLDLGEGDDEVTGFFVTAIVDAGPGSDYITAVSSVQNIHGGAGDDYIRGGSSGDSLSGGPGDDELRGGAGADTLIAGPGDDQLYGWTGDDILHLDQGSNVAHGEDGADTFVLYRTGRLQTIADFSPADTLDLSDWSNIGPAVVTQIGGDVEITAALERVVLPGAAAAEVAAGIVGVPVA